MCNDYGVDIPFRLFVEAFQELGTLLGVGGGGMPWGLPPSRRKAPV